MDKIVYTFRKNATEEIRASLRKFKDRAYVDLRVWVERDNGHAEFSPTKKGLTLSCYVLPELKKAVQALEDGLIKRVIVTRKISFNKKYAVEARGLWKLSDETRGGPFLSYIFVDEELNRLYYLEGYVDSPGRNKRDFIRELEVILSTFKTESELQTEKQS